MFYLFLSSTDMVKPIEISDLIDRLVFKCTDNILNPQKGISMNLWFSHQWHPPEKHFWLQYF